MLAKAGRLKEASDVADAIPRIGRVWKVGAAQPEDTLRSYRRWAEESVMLREAALERQELPEHGKRARRTPLRWYHDRIRQCRRRQVAIAWHSMSGEPMGDLALIGHEIAAYWGRAYSARQQDDADEEEFLSYVQEWSGPQLEWQDGQTQGLAAEIRDSAPGLDGLPYAWWATAPLLAHDSLDLVARRIQDGGAMPAGLSRSVTVTIPKAEILEDAKVFHCSADTIRPIALMQSGGKLIALRANTYMATVAAETVAEPQRGFLAGRRIEECILGFDGACTSASLCAGRDAAGLLLDFAQAFPSLVHGWLFRVLVRMRLPGRLVNLVRAMYGQNSTVFEVSGSPVAEVSVASGIRQGCPLSGSLFALALDPLLRRLMAHHMLASACLFAYADDLAAVLWRIRDELPHLLETLRRWSKVSGLALKAPKCVLLPLWDGDIDGLRTYLDDEAGLQGARVARAARYLGVTVGADVRGPTTFW